MKLLRYILFPLMPFYYLVTWLRNRCYDLGIKPSTSYDFPVICVGNLSVGGTGKTPMIEYLIRLLKSDYKIATLSRGYGRKTKGFVLADTDASAETIGDEPFQFYSKFNDAIMVSVDEERCRGIASLITQKNVPNVILLDDAFQHRKVKAGFNILLTTYSNLYVNDYVLPTGNLREPRGGAKRANVIVVTKSPSSLSKSDKNSIVDKINPKAHQHVFFSSISYSKVIISEHQKLSFNEITSNFTLVTGIANAEPLVSYLVKNNLKFEHLNFKDHHNFTEQNISDFASKTLILTTEKDYMRLKVFPVLKGKLFYLPIEVDINDATKFDSLIRSFVDA